VIRYLLYQSWQPGIVSTIIDNVLWYAIFSISLDKRAIVSTIFGNVVWCDMLSSLLVLASGEYCQQQSAV
jgi:hypothetical protein